MTDVLEKDIFGTVVVEKAVVQEPPPGVEFRLLKGKNKPQTVADAQRQRAGLDHYEMYKQHPVVRAAIDKKSQFAVAAGWTFKSTTAAENLDQKKKDKLELFLRRSNGKQLLRLTFKDIDIYGEAFWYVERSIAKERTPFRALRLNPRYMHEEIDSDGHLTRWMYGPTTVDGNVITYELDEILHFKLDDPENPIRGLSPLYSLERAVAQDIYAMEYNQKFFENSAQTGIIFIVKTSTADEAKRNRQWIEENYVGAQAAHKPLLIEGDVQVEKSVAKPAEMEFLSGRKLLRTEILMVLEMDPDKVGIHEDSNRSVAKETSEAFNAETIWPRQGIIEEVINNELILGIYRWNDLLFQFLEGDPRRKQDLADTRDKDLKSGRETLNQQREQMGYTKVEGGDEPFITTPQGVILVKHIEQLSQAMVDNLMAQGTAKSDTPPPQKTAAQAEASSQNQP